MRPLLLALALLAPSAPRSAEEFTFLHCSDTHSPIAGSEETISEMKALGEVELEPYKVKAKAPSFAIVTGDLTEFGARDGWARYSGWWTDAKYPVYHGMGNHDATWDSVGPAIRKLHGGTNYSFDKGGCHFVSLDSTTPQEPRPSFGEEDLLWLADDLRKVKRDTPVFVFMHHPPEGTEFASAHDLDRFFEVLEPCTVAALLVGHYHTAWHRVINGFDVVCGGSTFTKDATKHPRGYNVCSVKDGVLRIAHKTLGEPKATKALLEKKLAPAERPRITVRAPREDETVEADSLVVTAEVRGVKVAEAACAFDNEETASAKMTADKFGRWNGTLSTKAFPPGVHFARVTVTADDKKVYTRSVRFVLEREGPSEVRWRVQLPTSVKTQPRPHADRLYVGGVDGKLYALRLADGVTQWTFPTGGEILGSPAAADGTVFFGSGDGNFYAVDAAGKEKWRYAAGAAVYSSPVLHEGKVVFGDNAGVVHALDVAGGEVKWKFERAGYSIESALHASATRIFFGAWDEFVYALDAKTGRLAWKCRARGPEERTAAKRYYSPADCGPVLVGGRLYCADRDYKLSIISADGRLLDGLKDVSATASTADGLAVILRRPTGLLRLSAEGATEWSLEAALGTVPVAPVEEKGIVYACSSAGVLHAVDAASGKLLWQRQVTPRLYVFAPPGAKGHQVFVAGMDGSVTCVANK